ncbi:hypothetical protein [Burkholderia sp. Bp9142]|uniref:hypothetical protein n=1 Tax=Burkholderia sp. Bp9142 TaxID=2184573 RepID=UPI0021AB9650|nr:hypothetical protein [Burkholderia sp. Bp9142]
MTKNKGRETEARGPPYLGFQRIQCKAADGSILVVRIFGGLMNLDAFFAFSAMHVRFVQVTGRAFYDDPGNRRLPFTHGQALRRCPCCASGVQRSPVTVQRNIGLTPMRRMELGFSRMARLLRSLTQYRSPICAPRAKSY